MHDFSGLIQQFGLLAERRSKLLEAEAKLWADAKKLLFEVAAVDLFTQQKAESAPKRNDDRDLLLSTPQAADFLNLAATTLNKWRLQGGGPEFVKLGRRVFYRQAELTKFVNDKTYPHTSAYK